MRHRAPCSWNRTPSMDQRSTVSSLANSFSLFIFPLGFGVCSGNLRSKVSQAKSKMFEQSLTLSDSQGDFPLPGNEFSKRLAIPEIGTKSETIWASTERCANTIQLLGVESARSPRPVPLSQAGKSFLFESLNPVCNCPRSVTQKPGHFSATQSLRDHQHAMEPVIITGFIGTANLILQGQNYHFGIGTMDSLHSADMVPRSIYFAIIYDAEY